MYWSKSKGKKKFKGTCWHYNGEGHMKRNCPQCRACQIMWRILNYIDYIKCTRWGLYIGETNTPNQSSRQCGTKAYVYNTTAYHIQTHYCMCTIPLVTIYEHTTLTLLTSQLVVIAVSPSPVSMVGSSTVLQLCLDLWC